MFGIGDTIILMLPKATSALYLVNGVPLNIVPDTLN